ncbi:hypothetical protein HPP92_004477 [Vanilla planifolia]|uniref:GDP-D-glucose phosphorylase 1 n=1 Tax=Vanilla planifolia TaxID=51239 RepID=A0A835S4G2_VANPL|nr:hypothetical protein HPP92_004477 [Vanilla planifolia]
MLTIKRVPTVLSNYQENASGCGRNCLGSCCLPVSKLPLYAFRSKEMHVTDPAGGDLPVDFFLNTLVLGQWEERMNRGLFRYDVTACETKVIPGVHGFVAQLNEGRHLKKRPTEFRVDQVIQPFDPNKFNFTKVGQEEVLFRFEAGEEDKSCFFESAPVDADVLPNVVAINVSPIEYGHVLLIPRVLECLPQRIDPESFLLALHMAVEAGSPYFRLGYNSLGAFATINHLHFQAYYLAIPFPVEKALTQKIKIDKDASKSNVKISRLLNYPVRDNNIPFNVLISDSGKRIFLFPQCYAEKQALGEVDQELLETQVNPAVWEISGHMVLKRRKDYNEASEDYAWRLLSEVSLSEERFQEVKSYVLGATGMMEFENNPVELTTNTENNLLAACTTPTQFPGGCLVLQ